VIMTTYTNPKILRRQVGTYCDIACHTDKEAVSWSRKLLPYANVECQTHLCHLLNVTANGSDGLCSWLIACHLFPQSITSSEPTYWPSV